ncbi:MAG: two-component sensor histidine kinase [Dactylosporangium sp.]|nr:ATP-binding protein [Dactylosporangium sp.]NNJ61725.1 two-component sensor histidine kinase [Dactylosporangium sp.]
MLRHGGRSESERLLPLYQSMVDALEAGVVVLDQHNQVILANPSARTLGMLREDDQLDLVILPLVVHVRRSKQPRGLELDLPRTRGAGGGRREPCGVNLRAVALDGGCVAIEAADVTEAHRLAKVRRDFVANVSHELKTPVGALRLLAEALTEATESDEETGISADIIAVRRFAERIKHESTRLGRLVSDLLELTRLQGAEPLPEPTPVDLDGVIAEIIDRVSTPAVAKGIEVVVDGTRGLRAHGHEGQLRTALANLAENAIAYSAEGTRVTLTARQASGAVEILVTDQGIGIAARDLDRIFERFYRADKARSRVTGGTGLGLAIVKHVATNHGGRVDVVSEVGKGSVFTLRLPASPPGATLGQGTADGIGARPADLGRETAWP